MSFLPLYYCTSHFTTYRQKSQFKEILIESIIASDYISSINSINSFASIQKPNCEFWLIYSQSIQSNLLGKISLKNNQIGNFWIHLTFLFCFVLICFVIYKKFLQMQDFNIRSSALSFSHFKICLSRFQLHGATTSRAIVRLDSQPSLLR